MRLLSISCAVLALAGFAAAQATIINGYATSSVAGYPFYSAPRLVTPSVSLQSPSPAPVGASNATSGNQAGARNSTLSMEPGPTSSVFSQPVWYGTNQGPVFIVNGVPAQQAPSPAARKADFGAASFQSNQGLAQVVSSAGPAKKAAHAYTNEDIDRVIQDTGTVKLGGKVEHLN